MPPLDFKTLKTLLLPVLRLIFAIALAWLWVLLCATPAYAQDRTPVSRTALTYMSCYDPNTTGTNFTDLMVAHQSLLILCDRTSEENS